MRGWWTDLDRILRGEATRPEALRRGTIVVPVGGLTVVLVVLGAAYGACMGSFALFKAGGPSWLQMLAGMVKVPALFLLTLAVTFPSLYVFNALVGSRLTLVPVLRLLLASLGVILAVLASVGPIVAFFSVSTTSYTFMVLLNVAVFAAAGALGLAFLLQTLQRLSRGQPEPEPWPAEPPSAEPIGEEKVDLPAMLARPGPGALDAEEGQILGRHVKVVFWIWLAVFALVGAQMGWVLRPFIGDPDRPFAWFRERDSNFFEAVWHTLTSLLR